MNIAIAANINNDLLSFGMLFILSGFVLYSLVLVINHMTADINTTIVIRFCNQLSFIYCIVFYKPNDLGKVTLEARFGLCQN